MTLVPRNALAVMASRQPTDDDVDFFPTPPWGARAGAEIVKALDPHARTAWEPCCGAGHMAHGLSDYFERVHASDAYLYDGNVIHDFTSAAPGPFGAVDWIIGNPPFAGAEAFIRRAYADARRGVAMLMRAGMMEGQDRHQLMTVDCPLTVFAPFSERLPMHRGRYEADGSSAAFYAWFIWLKPAMRPERFMARIGGRHHAASMRIAPGARARLFRPSDLRFAVLGKRLDHAAALKRGLLVAPSGDVLSEAHLDLLVRLAAEGDRGVTPHQGAFNGGLLASLRMFGLVDQGEPDRLGDKFNRVNAAGADMLLGVGVSA